MPHILVINPNISESVTSLIEQEARKAAHADTRISMATAAFGVEYIETRSEAAIGAHAVLDIVANAGDAFDAIVIAAFGDPGVKAAKEIALCPVVGISESAFATAGLIGGKFSIIAISKRITAWYQECAMANGAMYRLASIHSLSTPLKNIATVQEDNAERLMELCNTSIQEDGADCIILAGAPLAGLGRQLRDDIPVPLVDGVSSGIVLAEALARLSVAPATAGSFTRPSGKVNQELSPALARLFTP